MQGEQLCWFKPRTSTRTEILGAGDETRSHDTTQQHTRRDAYDGKRRIERNKICQPTCSAPYKSNVQSTSNIKKNQHFQKRKKNRNKLLLKKGETRQE